MVSLKYSVLLLKKYCWQCECQIEKAAQKLLWAEAVHTCECVCNSMTTLKSTKSHQKFCMDKKPRSQVCSQILGVLCISQKGEKIKVQMRDNTYKAIMFIYTANHTRYTYNYITQKEKVIMSRYIKWEDCKKNNPEETIKMFRSFNEKDLGPSI